MGPSRAGERLNWLPPLVVAFGCALAGCGHWTGAAHPPRLESFAPSVRAMAQAHAAAGAARGGQPGVFHTVKAGETLYRIARSYGVPLESLARENAIDDAAAISEGQAIFIPNATAEVAVPEPDAELPPSQHRSKQPLGRLARAAPRPLDPAARGTEMAWPVRGVLFSGFGARARDQHDGIDLAAPEGTAVVAAAPGTVLFSGEQRGYGKIVLVGHAGALGDVVTVYAHNSENLVASGDRVDRGEVIARVGHTGNATGPHLHFEVRVGARPRDPLGFLR